MMPTLQNDSSIFSGLSSGWSSTLTKILQKFMSFCLLCSSLVMDAQTVEYILLNGPEEDTLLLQKAQNLSASIQLESSSACAEHLALTRAMRRSLEEEFTLIDPLCIYPSGLMFWPGLLRTELEHEPRRGEPVDKAVVLQSLLLGSNDHWAENSLVFSLDTNRLHLHMDFSWKRWSPTKPEQVPLDLDAHLASRQEKEQRTQSWLSTHFRDFYFKNEEVTNREYREFTEWVKDSIVQSCIQTALPERTFPKNEPVPFQDRAIQRALFDHGLIFNLPDSTSCAFLDWNAQALTYKISGESICVYPDTLCWLRDFFPGNESFRSTYFWHPAYDDHPVVGVSWLQTQAFLHWKENQINKAFRDAGIAARVTLRLPEYHEWILAHSDDPQHVGAIIEHKAHAASARTIRLFLDFDLMQCGDDYFGLGYTTRDSPLQELLHGNERLLGDFLMDGALFTQSVHSTSWSEIALYLVENQSYRHRLLRKEKRSKPGSVRHQSSNVSEWLHNGMAAWNNHCNRFQAELDHCESEECEILRARFERQQRQFDGLTDGKLVAGANWFDERMGISPGGIIPGVLAKNFMDANSTSASLGFRYVMRISPSTADLIVP